MCRNVVYEEGKRKKFEAAHRRWLRKILHISWKDMVSNEKVRELTGQQLLGYIIRERRLRWCGHVWRMTTDIPARAVISCFPTGHKRKRRRPRIDWIQTIKQDLNRGGLKWEDLPELTANRVHWKQLTALCVILFLFFPLFYGLLSEKNVMCVCIYITHLLAEAYQ